MHFISKHLTNPTPHIPCVGLVVFHIAVFVPHTKANRVPSNIVSNYFNPHLHVVPKFLAIKYNNTNHPFHPLNAYMTISPFPSTQHFNEESSHSMEFSAYSVFHEIPLTHESKFTTFCT